MNKFRKGVVVALLVGLLMPNLMINAAKMLFQVPVASDPTGIPAETFNDGRYQEIRIRVKQGNEVTEMELEAYLLGVVLGEMPASFEEEALMAQAVVARTYTLRRREAKSKHDDADVCTDPACCQAYVDPGSYDEENSDLQKVYAAVTKTRGQVLTYEGKLIEATYFSSSGGRTEDAVAVWGSDVPYLQAVDSPETDYAHKYLSTVTFSQEAFQEKLGVKLPGRCEDWFGAVEYTGGGGVDTLEICGEVYEGIKLRQLLGLRSTAFSIEVSQGIITVTTRGFGHRVGMSQYGAEAMAVDGCTYEQILAHYYRNTQLEEFVDREEEFR